MKAKIVPDFLAIVVAAAADKGLYGRVPVVVHHSPDSISLDQLGEPLHCLVPSSLSFLRCTWPRKSALGTKSVNRHSFRGMPGTFDRQHHLYKKRQLKSFIRKSVNLFQVNISESQNKSTQANDDSYDHDTYMSYVMTK